MIIHDFDPDTEPVVDLSVFYGEPRHILNKCLILFSKEIQSHLLDHFSCTQIAEIESCSGNTPIYKTRYRDQNLAFYLTGIGSTLASCNCITAHWLTGADQFMMFGSCGSLCREKTDGRYILPTEAYRGEGCSYYYAEPSDYIAVRNCRKLARVFDEMKVPYMQGRVWTVDSMLRETRGLVQRRRSEGCVAVEMELAGVQALCDFYGLQLYDFLEAGDVLADSGYEVEGLSRANHHLGKLFIAMEALARL